ncbi:MAG: sterol desaturase family protein [Acidimicrobiales bacterium]|nr:sterol desaturase family protein [Acidimicrobiales bacterium]
MSEVTMADAGAVLIVRDTGPRTARPAAASLALAGVTALVCAVGVVSLAHGAGLWRGLATGWAVLLAPAVLTVVATVLVLERRWPAEPRPMAARGPLHDGLFFLVHVVAVVPFMTLLSAAFAHLLLVWAPWAARSWTHHVPTWLLVGATFVLMDGANWLAHRVDHGWSALWRFHALHHSQEEVSVLTSFRAHPLSHLPGFLLAAVPPFVLFGGRGVAPALITVYVCLGTIPHANVDWSYGWAGRLLVSPAYHRLHHAVDGPAGSNLGVVLTVWDVLSGRARWPTAGARRAPTGLAGRPVPVEQGAGAGWRPGVLVAQLAEPFVARPR